MSNPITVHTKNSEALRFSEYRSHYLDAISKLLTFLMPATINMIEAQSAFVVVTTSRANCSTKRNKCALLVCSIGSGEPSFLCGTLRHGYVTVYVTPSYLIT